MGFNSGFKELIFTNTTEMNPLETKRICLFYIRSQCVPRSKHYPPRL